MRDRHGGPSRPQSLVSPRSRPTAPGIRGRLLRGATCPLLIPPGVISDAHGQETSGGTTGSQPRGVHLKNPVVHLVHIEREEVDLARGAARSRIFWLIVPRRTKMLSKRGLVALRASLPPGRSGWPPRVGGVLIDHVGLEAMVKDQLDQVVLAPDAGAISTPTRFVKPITPKRYTRIPSSVFCDWQLYSTLLNRGVARGVQLAPRDP